MAAWAQHLLIELRESWARVPGGVGLHETSPLGLGTWACLLDLGIVVGEFWGLFPN